MPNKMLIDASHPEETRVVVVRGQKVEEFDFESASRRQLRGNIYLAKVTRVEPSLQAAFVEYGGNRHGFLAFSEIHPDYYQIPIADRQALLAEHAEAAEREERDDDRPSRRKPRRERGMRARTSESISADAPLAIDEAAPHGSPDATLTAGDADHGEPLEGEPAAVHGPEIDPGDPDSPAASEAQVAAEPRDRDDDGIAAVAAAEGPSDESPAAEGTAPEAAGADAVAEPVVTEEAPAANEAGPAAALSEPDAAQVAEVPEDGAVAARADTDKDGDGEEDDEDEEEEEEETVEHVGGTDALEELPERRFRPSRRQYKIQEVIKRRQILLVQVVKEERGNKGAALTTYLSLAGRYSVLMPNTARGGGISRKITNSGDRKRLKEIAQELEVPEGMGIILRTAGAARTKPEVKRDFEYLLRLWESVRELTLRSTAPALVYEEGSLIKRAIRDLYNKDIDEVQVSGEEAYREAKNFMRMLMPSHAKAVQPYRGTQPLFAQYGVEPQLDAMFSNQVTLRSGGYIVINPTEALVSIDVNSGRSTREHSIEDTALRTNLEAADEIARQLRLRDLAGLIVIDFIDMEESRNNRAVEKRMKECLKNDRARIQVGRISPFGLMEMSRQRIRTGVLESSSVPCPHCGGIGTVRAVPSIALHVLRLLEDTLIRSSTHNLVIRTRTEVALYILNQKRTHLRDLETRFGVEVMIQADDQLTGSSHCQLERGEPATGVVRAPTTGIRIDALMPPEDFVEDADIDAEVEEEAEAEAEGADEGRREGDEGDAESPRRRRRRRRRSGRSGDEAAADDAGVEDAAAPGGDDGEPGDAESAEAEAEAEEVAEGGEKPVRDDEDADEPRAGRRRRRGRRGGRRERDGETEGETLVAEGEPDVVTAAEAAQGLEEALVQDVAVAVEPDELSLPGITEATPSEPEPPAPVAEAVPAAEALGTQAAADVQVADEVAATPATPRASEPETIVIEQQIDPNRPRRSGWWSRAKTAITGG
ncbi:Rne/Rng family ribonuclease [Chelatococcus reniformis]|uniref:Ribonuclease E n=1 Tax=Chelatococcus reniformis TaxID=1494448 RepID=A0A916U2J3_9HYPH|nr:Rne/Rng family ribonuclease [Chelatococcus reniformis]GGC56901.1 hypothetical protein GCM10010994_14770 [Chelatococcus reniformis]